MNLSLKVYSFFDLFGVSKSNGFVIFFSRSKGSCTMHYAGDLDESRLACFQHCTRRLTPKSTILVVDCDGYCELRKSTTSLSF